MFPIDGDWLGDLAASVTGAQTAEKTSPLKPVLVGCHAARTVRFMVSFARPDEDGVFTLPMSLPDARLFVVSLDEWATEADRIRARFAPTGPDPP